MKPRKVRIVTDKRLQMPTHARRSFINMVLLIVLLGMIIKILGE